MSTTSSPPVLINTLSYSDVEKKQTHKVDQVHAFVSNANNSKAILTAFMAKISKKGSRGIKERKEKQPVESPTCVIASSEIG